MTLLNRLQLLHKLVTLLTEGQDVVVVGEGFLYQLVLRHFIDFVELPDFQSATISLEQEGIHDYLKVRVMTGACVVFADVSSKEHLAKCVAHVKKDPPYLLLLIEMGEDDLKDVYNQYFLHYMLLREDSRVQFFRL